MNAEKAIEHLGNLRHEIKKAMGGYINQFEQENNGPTRDFNDGTILAALTSVLCEMLHACGEQVDDEFIERMQATYQAVVLARQLAEAVENSGAESIPMPTTTLQ